ncbi:MAG: hypothetical protein JXX28_19125 [Deltaproteobacteria bacterium]|nr:hypothetical protein [Deltaproteobacteria bacterium]
MTPDLRPRWWALAALLWACPVQAEEGAEGEQPPAEEEDPLSPYRMSFASLTEHAIGTASQPVAFSWRRTHTHLAGSGSFLSELNNFDSARAGAMVRLPGRGSIVEISTSYVWTWDTHSSRQLALTPYRQFGRPSRLELDLTLVQPLAEGVVTAVPGIFPATQMVFNAYGSVRYLVYPSGFSGMNVKKSLAALVSPTLTEAERENLEDHRLDAMEVDPARYGLMLGLGDDLYFKQGLFVSPRVMVALPVLAPATETGLLLWTDLSLAVGVAF